MKKSTIYYLEIITTTEDKIRLNLTSHHLFEQFQNILSDCHNSDVIEKKMCAFSLKKEIKASKESSA